MERDLFCYLFASHKSAHVPVGGRHHRQHHRRPHSHLADDPLAGVFPAHANASRNAPPESVHAPFLAAASDERGPTLIRIAAHPQQTHLPARIHPLPLQRLRRGPLDHGWCQVPADRNLRRGCGRSSGIALCSGP